MTKTEKQLRVVAMAMLALAVVFFIWAISYIRRDEPDLCAIQAVGRFPIIFKKAMMKIRNISPLLVPNEFPDLDGFRKNGVVQPGAKNDDGYLLLSVYDETRKQSVVKLIRIADQQVLHEWAPDIMEMAKPRLDPVTNKQVDYKFHPMEYRIGHPYLLDDGGLIFHDFEGPLFNIDACSKVRWRNDQHFHHSVERDSDGNFWVPSVMEKSAFETLVPGYRDDAIAKISLDGKVLYKKSVAEILQENGYAGLLFGVSLNEKDAIHLNQIRPAMYSTRYWMKGDLLLSSRHLSTVLIYRPSANKIVWLKTGPWLNQHDPEFVGQSRIRIFGNDVIRHAETHNTLAVNGHSDLYQYDFADDRVTKPYTEQFQRLRILSETEGRQKTIDDRDVFVEETERARLLRLSHDKVVWEYVSRVDDKHVGMVNWSRYLTKDAVSGALSALQNANCR